MSKKTVLLSSILIAGLLLTGCQKNNIFDDAIHQDKVSMFDNVEARQIDSKSSQKVETYMAASISHELSDAELNKLTETYSSFTNAEYLLWLNLSFKQAINNTTTKDEHNEYEERYKNALIRNEESLEMFGQPLNQIQFDVKKVQQLEKSLNKLHLESSNTISNVNHSLLSCPSYSYNIPSSTTNTASISCCGYGNATYIGDPDCDYEFYFSVNRSKSKALLALGGINGRHITSGIAFLMGKNRTWIYHPIDGPSGVVNQTKLQNGMV